MQPCSPILFCCCKPWSGLMISCILAQAYDCMVPEAVKSCVSSVKAEQATSVATTTTAAFVHVSMLGAVFVVLPQSSCLLAKKCASWRLQIRVNICINFQMPLSINAYMLVQHNLLPGMSAHATLPHSLTRQSCKTAKYLFDQQLSLLQDYCHLLQQRQDFPERVEPQL